MKGDKVYSTAFIFNKFVKQPVLLLLLCLGLWSSLMPAGAAQSLDDTLKNVGELPSLSESSEAIVGKAAAADVSIGGLGGGGHTLSGGSDDRAIPANAPPPPVVKKPRTQSKFQQFVAESTGRTLPVYGQDLFDNPDIYRADSTALPSQEYALMPGDEIRLQLWGSVDYTGSHVVDRNGQISLPKVGSISVAGVQVRDLEAVLKRKISTVFTNFNLNANLGRLRGITVYVVGQAQQPGTHQLSSVATLVNAIFASGGPTSNGSMRAIQLKRGQQVITNFDLYKFIAKGDKSQDVPLQSGDVIVIPPVGPQVAITGAFDYAAIYELSSDTTQLKDIFALTGGLPKLVDVSKALLERVDAKKTPPRQVQEITLNAAGLEQHLLSGDVVTLLPLSPAFGNTVTLQGAVAQPLRHRWFEGMRISDLIPEREALISPAYYKRKNQLVQSIEGRDAGAGIGQRIRGLVDEINWDYAVVERLNPKLLRTDLFPFNLGQAVMHKDPQHNLLLQPGDVVTILSHSDLRLPDEKRARVVRVEGEVAAPGMYQLEAGETLPKFLTRIGGVTRQAYLYGTEFQRESVRRQQQSNLDELVRKLEDQLESNAVTKTQNPNSASAEAVSAQLQAQQKYGRAKIERIKQLKSKGRIALEIEASSSILANPQRLAMLPDVLLEDGDSIYVPSIPSFLTAVGSVLNENVLIYKPGKTVGDVIKSVGLAEDAEVSEIFVLRADGTIVSQRDRSFLRSINTLALMPGDTVIVPAQWDRESGYNFTVRALKDWTQILANFGLGIASLVTFKKL